MLSFPAVPLGNWAGLLLENDHEIKMFTLSSFRKVIFVKFGATGLTAKTKNGEYLNIEIIFFEIILDSGIYYHIYKFISEWM